MPTKNFTFLVGAPGSRWSGVGQLVAENFNYDRSDENHERVYAHGKFSGHRGAYWGPGMELGHDFHRLESIYGDNVAAFEQECHTAFDENEFRTKLIRCHQFAYNLSWLYNNVNNSNILLVRRGNQDCFDWWTQAGGWDISYPRYDWYIDDDHMQHYIEVENKLSNDFVCNIAKWEKFDEEWLEINFGKHGLVIPKSYHDVEVCLINTKN